MPKVQKKKKGTEKAQTVSYMTPEEAKQQPKSDIKEFFRSL